MSESRLFKIVNHLINKGQATAPELAKLFEVSVRTIYRDIDALSNAGIPIYATNGRKGGIKLLENFTLSKSVLSEQEKSEILMGLRSLSAAEYPEAGSILSKLSALFQMNAENWIDVDLTRWGSASERQQRMFVALRKAVITKMQVEFEYVSMKGESLRRVVEPGRLAYRGQAWYLYGYCLTRNDWRLFRLTRIRNLVLTEVRFDRECDELIWPEAKEYGLPVRLELRFKETAAYKLYDVLNENTITQAVDNLVVSVTLPENEWLYSFLLSFGDSLLMIEPARIRDEVLRRYANAINQLTGG